MEIRSDIICRGSTWYKISEGYVHKFFNTMWDLFKICLSIGILYDKQIEDDNSSEEEDKITVPRSMLYRRTLELQFYFQSAILTSNSVNLSEKDRLYLAFSEEISEEELEGDEVEILKRGVSQRALEFDKISFLKKFANYGATKLLECLSRNDSETMENLMEFLTNSYKGETEELLKMKEVEELLDEYN